MLRPALYSTFNFTLIHLYFTGFRVAEDTSGDYLSARCEQLDQIVAGHVFRQTSNIQISTLDTVTARPR